MKFDDLIILIRHFPTEDELEDKVSLNVSNLSIIESAKKEFPFLINQLQTFLNRVQINNIYTSDSNQAVETANTLATSLRLPVTKSKLLRNIKKPFWEGLSNSEVRENFPKEFDIWCEKPGEINFDRGESIKTVRKRIVKFSENYIGSKIVITHTTTFQSFILENFSLDNNRAWDFKPEMYTFTVICNGTLWGLNTRSLDYLTLHYK